MTREPMEQAMPDVDWDLLTRWAAGECADDERARVELWLAEAPEHAALLHAIRDVAVDGGATTPAERKDVILASVMGQSSQQRIMQLLPAARNRVSIIRIALTAAAIAATAAMVGNAFLANRATPAEDAWRVLSTPRGQRAMFQLPDGTRVMLAAASTLRYSPRFEGGRREVTVEGEAYFDVVHDERRPFVARAGDLIAEDLGTQFVIRKYAEDERTVVAVREGVVRIEGAGTRAGRSSAVLGAGHRGYVARDGTPVVEAVDTALAFAWTNGRLVFTGARLADALPQLSRWYDLEFRLADRALGDHRLNATLRSQVTTDELNFLAASLNLRQVRSGSVVTLYPASR